MLDSHLRPLISDYKNAGLYRERAFRSHETINFASNDYLGLSKHPRVIEAYQKGVALYGVGSGASQMGVGFHAIHAALEAALAEFLQMPKVLLFPTGYMANLGVMTALLKKSDAVFADRLCHASLIDGMRFSSAKLQRYKHRDCVDLRERLQHCEAERKFIVSDGVFSMDGDIAPLPELVDLKKSHGATLIIDDAHGIGVLGESGAGSREHFSLASTDIDILVGTFGKAFGGFGAFVAGSETLIDFLIQFARTGIYTTALAPANAYAMLTSLQLFKDEAWRRERLKNLVKRFRDNGVTPIQALIIGDAEKAVRVSQALLEKGIVIPAIRPPTVPANTSRLRISFSAEHTDAQIDYLLATLEEIL